MPNLSDEELTRINRALEKAVDNEKKNRQFLETLGPSIVSMLKPTLDSVSTALRGVGERLSDSVKEMNVHVNPKVEIPPIEVPEPRVTVNVPKQDRPNVKVSVPTKRLNNTLRAIEKSVSEQQSPVDRMVEIPQYSRKKPIPALMVDVTGKPWTPMAGASKAVANMIKNQEGLTAELGSGTSEQALRVVNATDVASSVSLTGSTGSIAVFQEDADGNYRDVFPISAGETLTVDQLSGANWSVAVQSMPNTVGVYATDADGNYRDELPITGTLTAVTDITNSVKVSTLPETLQTQLDAVQTAVEIMDDWDETNRAAVNLISSETGVAGGSGEIGTDTIRVVHATDNITSVNIVSGSTTGTEYEDGATADPATGTVAMGDTGEESGNLFALRTHSGVAGSTVLRVVHVNDVGVSTNVTGGTLTAVTGITNSVAANIVDSSGVAYTTSNPLPIDDAGGAISIDDGGNVITVDGTVTANLSATDNTVLDNIDTNTSNTATAVQIMDDWDATHNSAAPSDGPQVMLEARTTNPTAVDNGDAVRNMADDVGRPVMRPVQVRDLMQTAYVTEDEVGEVTLLTGASGVFHDLVYIMGANESDAAINLDVRQTTGGTVQMSIELPANGTAGVAPPVPIPADHSDATWTVQNSASDNSNTTYSVTALFSKEV